MSSDPPAQQPLGAKVWPCCPWSAALGSGACGQTRNSTPAPTPGPGPARQSAASLRLSRPAGPGRMSGCCGPPVAHWPGRQDNLQRVACEGSGHPEFPPQAHSRGRGSAAPRSGALMRKQSLEPCNMTARGGAGRGGAARGPALAPRRLTPAHGV